MVDHYLHKFFLGLCADRLSYTCGQLIKTGLRSRLLAGEMAVLGWRWAGIGGNYGQLGQTVGDFGEKQARWGGGYGLAFEIGRVLFGGVGLWGKTLNDGWLEAGAIAPVLTFFRLFFNSTVPAANTRKQNLYPPELAPCSPAIALSFAEKEVYIQIAAWNNAQTAI